MSSSTSNQITELHTIMRKQYISLLLDFPISALSTVAPQMDVHGAQWKYCFYHQIEDYRKSVRKCLSIINKSDNEKDMEKQRDKPGNPKSTLEKAKHHLSRLVTSYAKFLSDGIVYYSELLFKVEQRLRDHGHEGPKKKKSRAEVVQPKSDEYQEQDWT